MIYFDGEESDGMITGDGADAVEDSRAARVRRCEHAQYFAAMDVKRVQQTAGVDVPQFDAEIDAARKRVRRIVTKRIVVRIQQSSDFAAMTFGPGK